MVSVNHLFLFVIYVCILLFLLSSADNNLMIFFKFSQKIGIGILCKLFFLDETNLYEMSKLIFLENKKSISECHVLKLLGEY